MLAAWWLPAYFFFWFAFCGGESGLLDGAGFAVEFGHSLMVELYSWGLKIWIGHSIGVRSPISMR